MKLHLISLSSFIFASVVLSGALTSCSNAALSAIEERLSKLEGQVAELNTVSEQMEAMTNTIHSLFDAQQKIQTRIGNLSDSSASYAAQIADLQKRVEILDPQDMAGAIFALQAEMDSTLDCIAALTAADSVLSDRIAVIEALKDSLATRKWVEGTFATLEAQRQTAAALAKVQALLAGFSEGKTVAEAIEAASAGVKVWVSDTLSHYWTAGVVEGRLKELESKISTLEGKHDAELKAVKKSVQDVQNQLEKAKAEIKAAYTAAINAARTELDGRITTNTMAIDKAAADIVALDDRVIRLETDVPKLMNRIALAEERLNGHDGDISGLKDFADSVRAMVQSAVFVPKYKGGAAVVKTLSDINSMVLDYEVLPCKAGKAIADLWNAPGGNKSIIQVNCRNVLTRAGLSSVPVTSVAFNTADSLLTVTVNLVAVAGVVLSSNAALAVSLRIDTGGAMVSSPFTDIDNTIDMSSFVDLNSAGTANCYIVSGAGFYKFNATVKGNGKNTDGTGNDTSITPAKADVLWKSFGTGDTPAAGDLISTAVYSEDKVFFETSGTFQKGNAVIAVRDASDKILWSWHIWLTDTPGEQVYNSNAGTMMDRNLGATSAEKGNIGALGLLYQWGRKDPFLGSGAIGSNTQAASSRPRQVESVNAIGGGSNTLEYSIANPNTFITASTDWYCTPYGTQNDNLWRNVKTMYDPCPIGWRVPEGKENGVWSKAGFSSSTGTWHSDSKGYTFGIQNGTAWYPAAGYLRDVNGNLMGVGDYGNYWSYTMHEAAQAQKRSISFYIYSGEAVYSDNSSSRAEGNSVRCLKE